MASSGAAEPRQETTHASKHPVRDRRQRRALRVARSRAAGRRHLVVAAPAALPSFSLLQRQLEVLCLALEPILMQRGTLDVEVALNTPTSPDDGEGGDPLECD